MATIQILRAMSVPVLGVVLFVTSAWADVDSRVDVLPIQHHQPVILFEGQPHGAQSMPMHRGGLPADSLKSGNLNVRSIGGRGDGSRTIVNSHSLFNSIRPEEFQEHGGTGSGIPLWRW